MSVNFREYFYSYVLFFFFLFSLLFSVITFMFSKYVTDFRKFDNICKENLLYNYKHDP